ncbi:hypothetical protein IAQ61_005335 [Plenodomus lingam]|uniref:uncharacterized protein n=1 Tax=Leptosphaeria maculans TaxID=5022 RepID=UPI00332D0B24|nr:hypothetical protein IAQ61_005335 [Plenodomus lingam]
MIPRGPRKLFSEAILVGPTESRFVLGLHLEPPASKIFVVSVFSTPFVFCAPLRRLHPLSWLNAHHEGDRNNGKSAAAGSPHARISPSVGSRLENKAAITKLSAVILLRVPASCPALSLIEGIVAHFLHRHHRAAQIHLVQPYASTSKPLRGINRSWIDIGSAKLLPYQCYR